MTVGRKPSENLLYARAIGLTKRQVIRLGGSSRLNDLLQNAPHAFLEILLLERKKRRFPC